MPQGPSQVRVNYPSRALRTWFTNWLMTGGLAASAQSMFGVGAVFSTLQSAAMGGYGVAAVHSVISGGAAAAGLAATAKNSHTRKDKAVQTEPDIKEQTDKAEPFPKKRRGIRNKKNQRIHNDQSIQTERDVTDQTDEGKPASKERDSVNIQNQKDQHVRTYKDQSVQTEQDVIDRKDEDDLASTESDYAHGKDGGNDHESDGDWSELC